MSDRTVVERRVTIAAAPAEILPLIVNFRRWPEWSPWEGLDPDLERTYAGAPSGVGATYEWSGNSKAGAGRMEITAVTATTVDLDLAFTRPFTSQSQVHFELGPADQGTEVVWQMSSEKTLMSRILGIFWSMEKMIGPDLEKGLTQLQAAVTL